jgi:hypothetical protein
MTTDRSTSCRAAVKRGGHLAAALACVALLGCGGKPRDVSAAASKARSDAEVIRALEPFDPWYLLNKEGRVVKLRLTDRHLTSAALTLVGKLTALERLGLDRTDLTDEGLAQLKDLQNLSFITFSATQATDDGLLRVAKLKGLKNIHFPGYQFGRITGAGIEKFKEMRPDVIW